MGSSAGPCSASSRILQVDQGLECVQDLLRARAARIAAEELFEVDEIDAHLQPHAVERPEHLSDEELGREVELETALGRGENSIPHGDLLLHFAEAATRNSDELPGARAALLAALGPEAFVEAAATVGIFNGLVQVADATGIPLDDGTRKASSGFRTQLGLNAFAGAASTKDDGDASNERSVGKLFDFESI